MLADWVGGRYRIDWTNRPEYAYNPRQRIIVVSPKEVVVLGRPLCKGSEIHLGRPFLGVGELVPKQTAHVCAIYKEGNIS